jgi:hypothetical protein
MELFFVVFGHVQPVKAKKTTQVPYSSVSMGGFSR